MAYFILAEPSNTDSFNSPLYFRLGSDNANQPGFRYVIDVYYDDGTTLYPISTLKVLPDGNLAGIVDVSRLIRNYVTNYFNPDSGTGTPPVWMDTDAVKVGYAVVWAEEYNVAGVPTLFYVANPMGAYTAWNTYNTDAPGQYPFSATQGKTHKLLTSRDTSAMWIRKTGNAFLSYLNLPIENYFINLQFLDADGKLFTTGSLGITSVPLGTAAVLSVLNVGVTALSAAPWNTPPTPAIRTDAGGYILNIYRPATMPILTASVTIRFLCEPKVAATCLHFLNRFGGFDTFYFTGPARKAVEMERKSYERIPMVDMGSAIQEYNGLNVYADTTVNYHQKQTHTRKLVSGYVNETDHNWLSELLASPVVYLEEGGYYYPVTINDNKWTQKLGRFDKMYNLELEITTGRRVISQVR